MFLPVSRYRGRFWKKCYFDAVDEIRQALAATGGKVSLTEAAIRWMYHHSKLSVEFDGKLRCSVAGQEVVSEIGPKKKLTGQNSTHCLCRIAVAL